MLKFFIFLKKLIVADIVFGIFRGASAIELASYAALISRLDISQQCLDIFAMAICSGFGFVSMILYILDALILSKQTNNYSQN